MGFPGATPAGAFFRRLRRGAHVRRKNASINRNIRAFLKRVDTRQLPTRELQFMPEVIIPCFNHGQYLKSALCSIPIGYPVTIVDDASTDDTPRIIRELSAAFSFKALRNDRNLLQSGSINRAVAESENNLYVVLNADDCLLPYTINTLLRTFRAVGTVRMVGGGAIPFSVETTRRFLDALPRQLAYAPQLQIFNSTRALLYRGLNDINMSMSGSAFLRSAWQAVGGFWDFDDRVCSYDDRDFQMRVSCVFDVGVLEEPLCLYRVNSSLGRAQFTD